jgi:hypothetical protein
MAEKEKKEEKNISSPNTESLEIDGSKTKTAKKKKIKIIVMSVFVILVIVIGWVELTIAWYIPNVLNFWVYGDPGCPPWQVMTSWTEYNDGRLVIGSCSEPLVCPHGKHAQGICGPLPDRLGCHLTCFWEGDFIPALKPVIYLYPTKKTDVQVKLDYQGTLIADFPRYDSSIKGWNITAFPDGHLINKADSEEYSYLFWEGKSKNPVDWHTSEWFVVKGENTREFLQDTLAKMGLTPKEYNEFIVYWYPLMKDNKYNLIHFAGKQYTDTAPLDISPKPDSLLRVFMVYKPLSEKIEVKKQDLRPFIRKWFTVIEWGGTKME